MLAFMGQPLVPHSGYRQDNINSFNTKRTQGDFRTELFIVADQVRKRQFRDTLELSAFQAIKQYVGFRSYEYVSEWHAAVSKLAGLEGRLDATS